MYCLFLCFWNIFNILLGALQAILDLGFMDWLEAKTESFQTVCLKKENQHFNPKNSTLFLSTKLFYERSFILLALLANGYKNDGPYLFNKSIMHLYFSIESVIRTSRVRVTLSRWKNRAQL